MFTIMFCASDDKYSPILAEERSNGEFHNIVAKTFPVSKCPKSITKLILNNADINWFNIKYNLMLSSVGVPAISFYYCICATGFSWKS